MADVRMGAFVPALILAPLVPGVAAGILFGLLFWLDSADNLFAMLAFIVIYATFNGAPTYLTFGTVAFLRAIARGIPVWIAAMAANFASAPIVLIVYRLFGPDWPDAILATVFHILSAAFSRRSGGRSSISSTRPFRVPAGRVKDNQGIGLDDGRHVLQPEASARAALIQTGRGKILATTPLIAALSF